MRELADVAEERRGSDPASVGETASIPWRLNQVGIGACFVQVPFGASIPANASGVPIQRREQKQDDFSDVTGLQRD